MTVLRTVDLTKKFGDFAALDGVNIEVGEGEIYGFIGPNGAGKSTTLRVLLGILKATDGRAKFSARIPGKTQWKSTSGWLMCRGISIYGQTSRGERSLTFLLNCAEAIIWIGGRN